MKAFFQKAGIWLTDFNVILVVLIFLAVFAGLQSYLHDLKTLVNGDILYTDYNNFLIFKYAFHHLIDQKDLYIMYPSETGDLYKYSPTFAVLFAPLAVMPDLQGVFSWNLINALVLFFAFKSLPGLAENKKIYMLWFVVIELMTSMQNDQSNGLIAGLLIFSFGFLEKNKYALATLFIVLTVYIKLFGLVAFAFFLLYPRKGKFILYSALWMLLFAILPLLFIPFGQLKFLYLSWFKLLTEDHSISYGFSVMGWLNTWFGLEFNKNYAVFVGIILFLVPFIRIKKYKYFNFRILVLASILIWIIIFNHKAESPSFIIAMTGVSIWFFSQKARLENIILLILAFVFTSLSTTDIFPSFIRHTYFYPYVVKVVPSIIVWLKVIFDLTFKENLTISEFNFDNRQIKGI